VSDVAAPPPPVLDTGRIARLRDVLAGGCLGLEPDRQLAKSILERWPGAAGLVAAANEFHRRSAAWAVRGGTPGFPVPSAAGVIFAASGYPLRSGTTDSSGRSAYAGFHATAQEARPDALFAYASSDPHAVAYGDALLAQADPGHVSAYRASARDPAGLLGAPQAQAILGRGPVMVQLQLCCHWWPADFIAWALAEYARLLPSGSTVTLSLVIARDGRGADGLAEAIGGAGGTVHLHTEDDVAGWIARAGTELAPGGIADVRGREMGWAAAEFSRQRPVARVVVAIAVVP
jgi:hypothetical protein